MRCQPLPVSEYSTTSKRRENKEGHHTKYSLLYRTRLQLDDSGSYCKQHSMPHQLSACSALTTDLPAVTKKGLHAARMLPCSRMKYMVWLQMEAPTRPAREALYPVRMPPGIFLLCSNGWRPHAAEYCVTAAFPINACGSPRGCRSPAHCPAPGSCSPAAGGRQACQVRPAGRAVAGGHSRPQ